MTALHPDIRQALSLIEDTGARTTSPELEPDNSEYGATKANIDERRARFRVGKITPSKAGIFVAVWQRASNGSTEPFPVEDDTALLLITARDANKSGLFILPKSLLARHGILSAGGRGGKRGFRLYPTWTATTSAQARRTQEWQTQAFIDTTTKGPAQHSQLRRLLAAI